MRWLGVLGLDGGLFIWSTALLGGCMGSTTTFIRLLPRRGVLARVFGPAGSLSLFSSGIVAIAPRRAVLLDNAACRCLRVLAVLPIDGNGSICIAILLRRGGLRFALAPRRRLVWKASAGRFGAGLARTVPRPLGAVELL